MAAPDRPMLSTGFGKSLLKENLEVQTTYKAFYTGGPTQLSKDGKHLFCCCGYQINVLDIETGKVAYVFGKEEEDDDVMSFVLSDDDNILIIARRSGLLRQWDWRNEVVTRTWKSLHLRPIRCMAFDCTATLLATGGSDATVKVWDIVKQYCTHNFKGAQGVFSMVKFHPDIERLQLFGAADDYKIHLWSLNTSKELTTLDGHYSPVTQVDFTEDGNTMVSCGRDKVILVWNLVDYKLKSTIPTFEAIETIFLLPENRDFPNLNVKPGAYYAMTGGSKGTLRVWNLKSANCVFTQDNSPVAQSEEDSTEIARIQSSSFNETLDSILTVTHDHNILFYKIEDFKLWKQLIGYNDEVLDICYLGEEETHIAVATNSPSIRLFELSTFNCTLLEGHEDIVMCVKVFPQKPNRMISGSKDHTIRLWEMNDRGEMSCIFLGTGHMQAVHAVGSSNMGSDFVISGSLDTTLKVWDIPQKVPLVLKLPFLASRATEKAHEKEINCLAISPNDKYIVTGSHDKTAKIWKSDNLDLHGTLNGHRKGIWCVQFSPVDQAVVTSSADGTIKIWALAALNCVKTFEGHECSVLRVTFLSRGTQLLSTASDGNIKLWTVKQNECIKTKEAHLDKVWALATSKNESMYITGGADSTIIIWKDVTDQEKEEALSKTDTFIEQEQKLSNLVKKRKWSKALRLAILLDQPFRALSLIKEIMMEGAELLEIIQKMRDDQILSLLKYAIDWNTNSKHCAAAQLVISAYLNIYTPEELLKKPEIKEQLEGLLPYTERHFQRMNRLQQQATFVDYMWQTMTLANPIVTQRATDDKPPTPRVPDFFVDSIGNETKPDDTEIESTSDSAPMKTKRKRTIKRKSDNTESRKSNGNMRVT